MRKSLLLLMFCCLASVSGAVGAQFIQQRFLPANGERGVLGAAQAFPGVVIDNRVFRLGPGARIYDRENRTIVHAQLTPGSEVFYSRDQAGGIQRIYILTEQELARLTQLGVR